MEEIILDVKEFEKIYNIASDDLDVNNTLLQLTGKYRVVGKQIHDCNIAATMIENSIKNIFTANNGDFKRYIPEGINVIPLSL